MLLDRFCVKFDNYDKSCLNRIEKYFAKSSYDHILRCSPEYKEKVLEKNIDRRQEKQKDKTREGYKT